MVGGLQRGGCGLGGVKGNTVVLISWNVACQKAGSTGTKPNASHPPALPRPCTTLPLPLLGIMSPSHSLSLSLSHETGEPPSPLPPKGSALVLARPPDRRIPSPRCCCCCWPAVGVGIQNRSLTSAWLLEYADVPENQRDTEGGRTHRAALNTR